METKRPIRVAIVGSGMAGLVTAYLLHRDVHQRYAVKLFESGSALSLDSASVSIPNLNATGARGTSCDRVDLPMRAFAGGYYNNLKAMYDHLGIRYHNQRFLFEFARRRAGDVGKPGENEEPHFVYASNLHKLALPRLSGIAATISYLLEALYLLACYAWFSICCFFVAPKTNALDSYRSGGVSETLDQYLRRIRLPAYFTTYYLLPLISSVTTCPHQSLLAFPANDLIEYKRRTHRAPHYTVSNGVRTVQDKLVDGIEYELSASVTSVEPLAGQVRLCYQKAAEADSPLTENEALFDKVILAIAPDVVGNIFEPLRYHMARIPTVQVESVVHTDRRTLLQHEESAEHVGDNNDPAQAQAIYLRTSTDGAHRTESHHVQPCGAVVTTCPFSSIDPALTIHSARFTRVLRSAESRRVINSIFGDDSETGTGSFEKALPHWRNGDDNVSLVGGWCWDGMVLLEGCVISAMRVAEAFDVEVPWLHSP